MSTRKPAQKPVPIPDHLQHGSSYVYRHYGCRCGMCQAWRREYDRGRTPLSRRGSEEPAPGRKTKRDYSGWYACTQNGRRYKVHQYGAGICIRCDAKQALEEFWERKWNET